MAFIKYITANGISETCSLKQNDFNEKFIFKNKEYIICYDKKIFDSSTFLKNLVDSEEHPLVNDNTKIAIGHTVVENHFDPDLFTELIYMILYETSKTTREKIEYLANISHECPITFINIHHCLYKLLITYYGFSSNVEEILKESFLLFLDHTRFKVIREKYFGMNFSKRIECSDEIQIVSYEAEYFLNSVNLAYIRNNIDVKYVLFCFEDAPFYYSKHFLLQNNESDGYLGVIGEYVKIEMNLLNKNIGCVNFFSCIMENHVKKVEPENMKKYDSCSSGSDADESMDTNEKTESDTTIEWDFSSILKKNKHYYIKCVGYFLNHKSVEIPQIHLDKDDSITYDASLMPWIGDIKLYCTDIILPSKMKELQNKFTISNSVKNIIFSEGLEEIGDYFLSGWLYKLDIEKIKFPSTLKKIGDNFMEMQKFDIKLDLPEGLEEIGDGFLNGCEHIKHITIPKSLKKFGNLGSRKINNDIILYFSIPPEDHLLYGELKRKFKSPKTKFLISLEKIPKFKDLVREYHKGDPDIFGITGYDWAENHVKEISKNKYDVELPCNVDENHVNMHDYFQEYIRMGILPSEKSVLHCFRECTRNNGKYSSGQYRCTSEMVRTFADHIMKYLRNTTYYIDNLRIDPIDLISKLLPMEHVVSIEGENRSEHDDVTDNHNICIYEYDRYYITRCSDFTFFHKGHYICASDMIRQYYEDFMEICRQHEDFLNDELYICGVYEKNNVDFMVLDIMSEHRYYSIGNISKMLEHLYSDDEKIASMLLKISRKK